MHVLAPQNRLNPLLDVLRLPLLQNENLFFTRAKLNELIWNQRVRDIQAVNGDIGLAIHVGQSLALQSANHCVVRATTGDNPNRIESPGKTLIERLLLDKANGCGEPFSNFFPLLLIHKGRQNNFLWLAIWGYGSLTVVGRSHIIPSNKLARHMTTADPHHVENRRVGCFRQLKALFHHVDDTGQIGSRVQEPHLRLHGERIATLLHDA